MTVTLLIIGVIAFIGGALLRRQQVRHGAVGTANPVGGFEGAGALIRDYFRIVPLALVGIGALLILASVLAIAFSVMIS